MIINVGFSEVFFTECDKVACFLGQSFPPMSNLDTEIYGSKESAIKEEHILPHLEGLSVQEVSHILLIIKIRHAYIGT